MFQFIYSFYIKNITLEFIVLVEDPAELGVLAGDGGVAVLSEVFVGVVAGGLEVFFNTV